MELNGVRAELSGWGRYPIGRTRVHRPERVAELTELVRCSDSSVARGLGRSYGDASFNSAGGTVLTERLNRFLSFDGSTGMLECEAGVTIGDVIDCFVPRGFFPPVAPGTKHVTLGGALACDIHGKNHHQSGSIGRHIVDFKLVTHDGVLLTCSRDENSDVFWATIGGMGLTGIVLQLRLKLVRVENAYLSVDYDRAPNIDAALELMHEGDDRYEHSVAWVDGLAGGSSFGRAVLMRANHAPDSAGLGLTVRKRRARPVPRWLPGTPLRRGSLKAFNALYYRKHPREARGVLKHYEPFFFQLDALRDWNRLYGPKGFTQYQCALPFVGGRDALVQILELFARTGSGPFLIVLKQFGPGESDQLLSFPIPGYTLAVDVPCRDASVFEAMKQVDDIVERTGGRIYLAKDARMSAERVVSMYDSIYRWRDIKAQIDPNNNFTSDLATRLALTP